MQPKSPWWLVAGVGVVLCVSSGFGFYNLSVYMNALTDARGFSVAGMSAGVTILFLASGASGVAVGRLIERHDVRWAMTAGAALGGVALALLGVADRLWQVWLLYALFGVGNGGVSLVPATTVVTRWFPGANRSLALSISTTGLSLGGVLLTPLSASAIHRLGVEAALPWFGAVYFGVMAPVALLLVRSWPSGARPAAPALRAAGVRAAIRSRFFIGCTLAYVLALASQVGGIAHVFNHAELRAGHVVASAAVSAVAAASIVGRLLGGAVLTAGFPIRLFACLNIAGQGVGLLLLGGGAAPAPLLAGAILFGLTIGNVLMLQALLLAQAFGGESYPRVFAIANAASTIGVAGGPLLMGLVYDASNYPWAFGAAALAAALGLLTFLAAGPLPLNGHASRRHR